MRAILEAAYHSVLFHLCEFREQAKLERNQSIDYLLGGEAVDVKGE